MSGPETDTDRPADSPAGWDDEEEYDEELAALSGPPPSLRHAVVICVILFMSGLMLYWFFPDLSYLLQGLEDPADLGESADILPEQLEVNSHVTIHGLPMVHQSIEFKEGIQWFAMSDTTRKLFPLTGQARLFVQWTVPEADRAYRDPNVNPERLAVPYDFSGRLIDPSYVGGNYDKIWVFYSCLEVYSLRQCKHCLGLVDMDDCRAEFTCAESFPAEECQTLLAPGGGGEAKQRAELDRLLAETERDELKLRTEALVGLIEGRRKLVEGLEREIADIESGARKQQINAEIADLDRRDKDGEAERSKVLARIQALDLTPDGIRADVRRIKDQLSLIGSEIGALKRDATAVKADLDELAAEQDEGRSAVLERIGERIRAEIAELDAGGRSDGGVDAGGAADSGPEDAGAGAEKDAGELRLAELRRDLEAIAAGELQERRTEQLRAIKSRLAVLDESKRGLTDERTEKEQLAQRLAHLPREARERSDELAELRQDLAALQSGQLQEEASARQALLTPGLERMKAVEPRVEALAGKVARLGPGGDPALEQELEELEAAIGPKTWILIDGETPGDKIWVVAVYLVFLVMIGFNLRRLHRFWIAWRS
jgi:hypothetical protein